MSTFSDYAELCDTDLLDAFDTAVEARERAYDRLENTDSVHQRGHYFALNNIWSAHCRTVNDIRLAIGARMIGKESPPQPTHSEGGKP